MVWGEVPPELLCCISARHPRRFINQIDIEKSSSNTSSEQQAVWQYGNSWGYQTISFELTTVAGKKFLVSRREEGFTVNFPSTFLIEPGEHQVFAIQLDKRWETQQSLPKTNEESISLRAIYEVPPTPEAARYKVWTGRLESHSYDLKLIQW